ncbi:MAG TPA: DciA family protein [Candidatus Omnitrophota bacterium]|nr:DciA family protein [Candidatus Omnitrophota bacterium]
MTGETNPLDKILKNVIEKMGKKRPGEEEISEAWAEAAGNAAARHSRPVALKKSVLVVNVDGSGWLYELSVSRREILARLGGLIKKKKIKDIRFRIGDITPPKEGDKKT